MNGSDNFKGIALMVLAMLGFAITDAFLKSLSGLVPTGQLIMTMGTCGGLTFAALAHRNGATGWRKAFLTPIVLTRNFFEAIGTMLFLTGLMIAPLSVVSALVQVTPLVVTLGAALWLREAVGPRRWSAILVGFFGVLLVIQPWSISFSPGALFTLAGVFFLAGRDLVTRRVPQTIPTMMLASIGMGLLLPAGALLMLFQNQSWTATSPPQTLLLAGAVIFSIIGYFGVTAAMRIGEASLVSAFRYSRIVFGLILAALFFGERPNSIAYAGMAIIVASGLYTMWRENKLRQTT